MEMQRSLKQSRRRLDAGDLGLYASLIAFIGAAGYCVVQILQILGVLTFPADARLIYGFSLTIAAPYVISVIAVHHFIPSKKRMWTHIAIAFAIMYATYVSLNYVVQLATVIPASIRGTADDIKLLDQTPHSLFWDIDALGYICMGISTLALSFAFTKKAKWLRRFLLANGLLVPVISFVYFYPDFNIAILLVGLPWIITAPGSLLLLSVFFYNQRQSLIHERRRHFHSKELR